VIAGGSFSCQECAVTKLFSVNYRSCCMVIRIIVRSRSALAYCLWLFVSLWIYWAVQFIHSCARITQEHSTIHYIGLNAANECMCVRSCKGWWCGQTSEKTIPLTQCWKRLAPRLFSQDVLMCNQGIAGCFSHLSVLCLYQVIWLV